MPRAKTAERLGLPLHDLATNALNFGPLSTREGRVNVSWKVASNGEGHLLLSWTESGGLDASQAGRRRSGTEFLERPPAYELNAETEISYGVQGLECRIRLANELGVAEQMNAAPPAKAVPCIAPTAKPFGCRDVHIHRRRSHLVTRDKAAGSP